MKRSRSVAVTSSFILAVSALSGCASDEDQSTDYTAVCVDASTQIRVDEGHCPQEMDNNNSSNIWLWYFIARSVSAPPVGSKVTGGSYARPATGTVGTAAKTGGFGTRAGAGG